MALYSLLEGSPILLNISQPCGSFSEPRCKHPWPVTPSLNMPPKPVPPGQHQEPASEVARSRLPWLQWPLNAWKMENTPLHGPFGSGSPSNSITSGTLTCKGKPSKRICMLRSLFLLSQYIVPLQHCNPFNCNLIMTTSSTPALSVGLAVTHAPLPTTLCFHRFSHPLLFALRPHCKSD